MVGLTLGENKLVTLGTVATASGLALGALWYKKYLKNKPPTNWTKIGEVGDLFIYPVKSCGVVKEDALEATDLGFRKGTVRDRMFLVINSEGRVVTGRDHSKMLKITPSVIGTMLLLSAPDFSENLELDFQNMEGNAKRIRIWGCPAEGLDCGDEAARWLSRYILNEDEGLRMLYNPKENIPAKPLEKDVVIAAKVLEADLKATDAGGFTDAASFHLVSEASIKELQTRVDNPVCALQFRPNIVVKGEKLIPFEEDKWEWIKIGDVIFRQLSPCFRCLFTTVNPSTAVKADDMEPLKTLRKYRMTRDPEMKKAGKSPMMGILLGARSNGVVNLNDDVYIPA